MYHITLAQNVGCGWNVTSCPELPEPGNGRVDISSLEPETTVRYSCDVGFQLSENTVRTCLGSGVWSGEAPNCTAAVKSCPTPYPPRNGRVSVDSRINPSEANFTCSTGFRLGGSSRRICLCDRGVWSVNTASCTRVKCVRPFRPLYGTVRVYYGNDTRAVYSCFGGYTLVGSRFVVCLTTGRWSGGSPTCIKIKDFCPSLSAPDGGQLSVPSRSVGSTSSYSCDAGKTLVGDRRRTCQSDGTWSETKPVCTRMLCCAVVICPQENG